MKSKWRPAPAPLSGERLRGLTSRRWSQLWIKCWWLFDFYDSDTTDDGIESIDESESDDENQDAEIEIEID